ncbi:MAG: EamA family transporter [Anaerolineae bacterium]
MKPQVLALITAMAWGIGGFFEKRGLHMGNLTPQVGITIRTGVALVILGAISFPQWKMIPEAGPKALVMMVIGGGVVAGAVGMLSFYAALRGADSLTQVMPIAFTSPLFSALMGLIFRTERLSWQTVLGMVLTIAGIGVLTTAPGS